MLIAVNSHPKPPGPPKTFDMQTIIMDEKLVHRVVSEHILADWFKQTDRLCFEHGEVMFCRTVYVTRCLISGDPLHDWFSGLLRDLKGLFYPDRRSLTQVDRA